MTHLHELSTRLMATTEFPSLLDEALRAVMALQHADFGVVQLYEPATRTLQVVAQRGFRGEFLDSPLFGRGGER